jgi:ABC-2 type transport system permease protein
MTALPRRSSAAWVLSDYWEMVKRSLRHIRHDPEQLANVTLQPVLIVVLMNFLFGGAIKTGTGRSYIDFVLPGVLVVAVAFAAITTTTGVAADMLEGVVDRFRTLPMAKSAVIAGHVVADLALSWLAALIGLLGQSLEAAQQLAAIIILPVFFSSALVPTATMPPWLRVVTANQPVTQAIDTLRALLAGQQPGSHLWLTLAEFAGLIVVAFALATALFRRTASR